MAGPRNLDRRLEIDPEQEEDVAPIPEFLGLDEGEQAPDFAVLDTAGNEVRLSDFAGQPVVLNFWATWCAPCRIEMPFIQAEFEKYKDEGLVVLALSQNEPVEPVIEYFEENGYTFTPCLLYTSPSPRDQRGSRMPSSA